MDVALRCLPRIERLLATGRSRSLYVERFPQGLVEELPYWAFCAAVVLTPILAAAWLAGWLFRQL